MPIQVIDRQCSRLVVCFSSIRGEPEFYDTFAALGYSVIYVLDNTQSWFSNNELGETFKDSQNYLRKTINSLSADRVLFTGFSMGGFGAMWYANALKPDKVVVFSPQSNLAHGQASTYLGKTIRHTTPNLYTMIKRTYNTPTDLHVGRKETTELPWGDAQHAKILSSIKSVRLIWYPTLFDHTSISSLKNSAKLENTFVF